MNRRVFTRINGELVVLLPHAVQRYTERACRYDDPKPAVDELLHLLGEHGQVQLERPAWVHPSEAAEGTRWWLVLGDDIAFPLDRGGSGLLAAITCVCRAGTGVHRRARRKRKRKTSAGMERLNRRLRRDQLAPPINEEEAA